MGRTEGMVSQGLSRAEVHGLTADDSEQGQNYSDITAFLLI